MGIFGNRGGIRDRRDDVLGAWRYCMEPSLQVIFVSTTGSGRIMEGG